MSLPVSSVSGPPQPPSVTAYSASNPRFCTDPSVTNFRYIRFPVVVIGSGTWGPQYVPSTGELLDPPSRT